MTSVPGEGEADLISKKRAMEGELESDLEVPVSKRAKYEEDEADDFGPAQASSSGSVGGGSSSDAKKGEWARVRLEAEVGEVSAVDALLSGSDRDNWMTMLPSERKSASQLDFAKMQQSVTTFSKRGVQRRGDTSSWTDTPADRAAREAGDARMTSLDMAKQLAAQRFEREAQIEARETAASFNTGERSVSLYEQVKRGSVSKEVKKSRHGDSDSDSDDFSSSSDSSSHHKRSSHRHKKSKEKKDKHRHKDKKRKEKHKDKRKKGSKSDDPQMPHALSTSDAHRSTGGYWDRERDLVRFGNRDSEQTRQQVFREASMLNSRFHSGGTSNGPSNLR